jgi:hypothetical protein
MRAIWDSGFGIGIGAYLWIDMEWKGVFSTELAGNLADWAEIWRFSSISVQMLWSCDVVAVIMCLAQAFFSGPWGSILSESTLGITFDRYSIHDWLGEIPTLLTSFVVMLMLPQCMYVAQDFHSALQTHFLFAYVMVQQVTNLSPWEIIVGILDETSCEKIMGTLRTLLSPPKMPPARIGIGEPPTIVEPGPPPFVDDNNDNAKSRKGRFVHYWHAGILSYEPRGWKLFDDGVKAGCQRTLC